MGDIPFIIPLYLLWHLLLGTPFSHLLSSHLLSQRLAEEGRIEDAPAPLQKCRTRDRFADPGSYRQVCRRSRQYPGYSWHPEPTAPLALPPHPTPHDTTDRRKRERKGNEGNTKTAWRISISMWHQKARKDGVRWVSPGKELHNFIRVTSVKTFSYVANYCTSDGEDTRARGDLWDRIHYIYIYI